MWHRSVHFITTLKKVTSKSVRGARLAHTTQKEPWDRKQRMYQDPVRAAVVQTVGRTSLFKKKGKDGGRKKRGREGGKEEARKKEKRREEGKKKEKVIASHFFLIPSTSPFRGGGHGSLLQYSCLENLMDRGA